MSHRTKQAARRAQLFAYAAEGNEAVRDQMIARIERAAEERRLRVIVLLAFVVAVLLKLAGWAFGFNV